MGEGRRGLTSQHDGRSTDSVSLVSINWKIKFPGVEPQGILWGLGTSAEIRVCSESVIDYRNKFFFMDFYLWWIGAMNYGWLLGDETEISIVLFIHPTKFFKSVRMKSRID